MDARIAKLIAAGALVGVLGVGGVSIASAQDGDDSTTTTAETTEDSGTVDDGAAPSDDRAARDGEDCPEKDGETAEADASASAS